MSRSESESEEHASAEDRAAQAPARQRTARQLVLTWNKVNYWVPRDAVVSLPSRPFRVEDEAALGALLTSKDPAKWLPVCKPDHMLMLKGKEGTCCYAILHVDGHDKEERFVRHLIAPVCAKNFPIALSEIQDGVAQPTDERERRRLDVLKWTPDACSAPQLDPKNNDWEVCSEEGLKSCRIDPARVPRALKRSSGDVALGQCGGEHVHKFIKFVKTIQVDDPGCEVIRRPGVVTIIQFKQTNAVDPAVVVEI
jgi:hypothetical protein